MAEAFTIDEKAIKGLEAEPFAGEAATAAARAAAAHAADIAPRGRTGRARRSYKSQDAELEDGVQRAYVYSDDPFAHLIEFGSAHNPAYRVLTRSVTDLGLHFEDARGGAGEESAE